jgi:hypothetical protein
MLGKRGQNQVAASDDNIPGSYGGLVSEGPGVDQEGMDGAKGQCIQDCSHFGH